MVISRSYRFGRCYDGVLCRYSEIATKGRNRVQFEDRLVESIQQALAPELRARVLRERGRIFLRPPKGRSVFTEEEVSVVRSRLPRVSGLSSASPGFLVPPELSAIEAVIYETFPEAYAAHAGAEDGPLSYCMRARRSTKEFPLRSVELEIRFADALLDRFPNMTVDLMDPDLRVDLEIREERAFVCYERIECPGGLPAGTGGRILALLSGGIDSPVACYQMMRRGCSVDFVTFHSEPYTPPALIRKVADLAKVLNRYQGDGRLVAVNLLSAQKVIRDTCTPRFRTLLYRRLMMRISCILAECLRSRVLVTGDNLGQVASQTLDNLRVVGAAAELMILRPLIAYDKNDTMAIARQIGTLDISETDVPDSCTVFAPSRPATTARPARLAGEEMGLNTPDLIAECLADTGLIDLDSLVRSPVPRLKRVLPRALRRLHPSGFPGISPDVPRPVP